MRDVKKEDGAKRPEDAGMLIDMALNDQHISQIGRIASLSEQISMLEERLDECKSYKYFRISLARDKNKWGKLSLLLISWGAPVKVRYQSQSSTAIAILPPSFLV